MTAPGEAVEAHCCSASSPCHHQKYVNSTTICDACKAAHNSKHALPHLSPPGEEIGRLRATLLNIQAMAERGYPIDCSKLAAQCRAALANGS